MQLNEELLRAWLRLSTSINNSRVVSEMTYNESLICNILYRNLLENPEQRLTATDLCRESRILKSQMNRILTQLEEKQLVIRERSPEDKRKVYVMLASGQSNAYLTQHAQILELLDAIIEKFGTRQTLDVIHSLNEISNIADELIK